MGYMATEQSFNQIKGLLNSKKIKFSKNGGITLSITNDKGIKEESIYFQKCYRVCNKLLQRIFGNKSISEQNLEQVVSYANENYDQILDQRIAEIINPSKNNNQVISELEELKAELVNFNKEIGNIENEFSSFLNSPNGKSTQQKLEILKDRNQSKITLVNMYIIRVKLFNQTKITDDNLCKAVSYATENYNLLDQRIAERINLSKNNNEVISELEELKAELVNFNKEIGNIENEFSSFLHSPNRKSTQQKLKSLKDRNQIKIIMVNMDIIRVKLFNQTKITGDNLCKAVSYATENYDEVVNKRITEIMKLGNNNQQRISKLKQLKTELEYFSMEMSSISNSLNTSETAIDIKELESLFEKNQDIINKKLHLITFFNQSQITEENLGQAIDYALSNYESIVEKIFLKEIGIETTIFELETFNISLMINIHQKITINRYNVEGEITEKKLQELINKNQLKLDSLRNNNF